MRCLRALSVLMLGFCFAACLSGTKSSSGFRLPDGDAGRGKRVFLELKCNDCHQISGDNSLPARSKDATVVLGGEYPYPYTDGHLVTSIINPSHKLTGRLPRDLVAVDGRSRMRDYSETMTVRQLIDLVAFLHQHYRYSPPESLTN